MKKKGHEKEIKVCRDKVETFFLFFIFSLVKSIMEHREHPFVLFICPKAVLWTSKKRIFKANVCIGIHAYFPFLF